MRGAEGVIHEDLGEVGHALRERGVVFLFTGVEAGVFEQKHVAIAERERLGLRLVADAIAGKGHRLADQGAERRSDGREGLLRITLAFRTAQVARQDDFGPFFDQELDRRQRLLDAGGVGDDHLAVFFFKRDVEVHAHKNAFSGEVEVTNGLLGHGF
jgi:hypothetical protein